MRRTLEVTVAGDLSFPVADGTHGLAERLARSIRITDQKVAMRKIMGYYVPPETPEFFECTEEVEDWDGSKVMRVPRGAVDQLKSCAGMSGVHIVWRDERSTGARLDLGTKAAEVCARLRKEYQPQAVDAILARTQGVIVMPCGGGKTSTGLALIGAIGRSALILVHTQDLLDQWVGNFATVGNSSPLEASGIRGLLGYDPGVISGGVNDVRDITVATFQSLGNMPQEALEALGRRFGVLIVDEAHHSPAATWKAVLRYLPARWRVGLTATPERADGMTELMYWLMGPKAFEVSQTQLIAWGYLQAAVIRLVYTDFCFIGKAELLTKKWREEERVAMLAGGIPEEHTEAEILRKKQQSAKDYQDCTQQIIGDATRNAVIVDLARQEYEAGETIIILSGVKEHCYRLGEMLAAAGVPNEVLTSDLKKTKKKNPRQEALDRFRAGTTRCVIATQLADEGLDVPRLSRLILAYPGKSWSQLQQRLGRIMRRHASKSKAVLYDLVDENSSQLKKQARERKKFYDTLGGCERTP